jgi:hypothetical protein
MIYDQNPGTRANTARTTPVVRTNPIYPSASAAQERVNAGHATYNAFEFQLDHHLGQSYQYRVSYTFSKSKGNTSGNGVGAMNFQKLTDQNLDLNEGPTDFDRPHNFVFSGSWSPVRLHGLTLGMVTRYLSGDPFTIQDQNFDLDQNGTLFDPLPAGKYTGTGRNAYTVFNKGGRNGARGPDFFQMDMRIGYRLPVVGTGIEVFGDIFNVTDRANFLTPSGNRQAATFLQLGSLRAGGVPRTAQIGAKVTF